MAPATIYALSSGQGRSALAVIRVSGPGAIRALQALTGAIPKPRRATVATIRAANGLVLDHALVLFFPAPRSATGEDLAEFHVHGGAAVVNGVLDALSGLEGLRLALPGEFTKRAFLNGRMDLTQAEGVADLIDAETPAQAALALRQLDGGLGALYEAWRQTLLRGLAFVEAVIDFPDEDVPDSAAQSVRPSLAALATEIRAHLADGGRGEAIRDGISVVLLGAPNAGKSTLLNALAKREAAIVADTPGTTRDLVEVRILAGGLPVTLVDTAGLRDSSDPVEQEGIRRARAKGERAHIRLGLADCRYANAAAVVAVLRPGDLLLWTKADLCQRAPKPIPGIEQALVSATSGQGMDSLRQWLAGRVAQLAAVPEAPIITRARHRESLTMAVAHLDRGLNALGHGVELGAEDLRVAARAIGRITGRVDVEDVLDLVFAEFCIGK
jgi:tRNA modification GTPase